MLAAAAGVAALGALPGPALAARPHLRLFAPTRSVTLTEYLYPDGSSYVDGNLGAWVEAVDGPVAVRASRSSYWKPVVATAVRGGQRYPIAPELLAGWNGFARFITATWHDAKGKVVGRNGIDWCPNGYDNSRTAPDGPPAPTFAQQGCAGNPFSLGALWGLDRSWAASVQAAVPAINLADGQRYTVDLDVRPRTGNVFGVRHADRHVAIAVTVKVVEVTGGMGFSIGAGGDASHVRPGRRPSRGTPRSAFSTTPRSAPAAASGGTPAADTLPDLRSLPSWGISTSVESGHDLLNFGATEWNAGPGPMVVEGFIQPGSSTMMDAYQGFYRAGRQVGFQKVGTIEYDSGDDGDWHFSAFAQYDLLKKDKSEAATSGKDSWCLAPTDAVDTLVPNAATNPGNQDFQTRCGYAGSVWLREVLAVGWGDTYNQARLGQSFDITDLPNGTYWIRVIVNPDGTIIERTRDNNTSYRKVILGGKKGARTVKVPPVGLVDSEAGSGGTPVPGPSLVRKLGDRQ